MGIDPLLQPGLLSGRGDDLVCSESVNGEEALTTGELVTEGVGL